MAQKNTSGISALQKMNNATKVDTEKKSIPNEQQPKTDIKPLTAKRKPGRPKTKIEETKTINIAVPVSVLKKLDTVKVCYENNLTQYINKLIEKDIEANYENYLLLAESLNRFK